MTKNYYAVLGVSQSASDEDIRRRFKGLARELHPDRFRGDDKAEAERSFQELTEAFNILTDPARRRSHDAELAGHGERAGSASAGASGKGDHARLVKAYLARGVQSYKEGDLTGATESFSRATELDSENPQAWYNLARVYSRQERFLRRAVDAIEKACELEPMKPSYRKLAGRLNARAERTARAEQHYKEALTWGGADAEVEQALEELGGGSKRRGFFGKVN